MSNQVFTQKIQALNQIGIALSAEKDYDRLLQQILLGAKKLTNADGGTLYLVRDGSQLEMAVVDTDSLDIHMGGTSDMPINFEPIPLYHPDGSRNLQMVVTRTVHEAHPINIADAYNAQDYDFSGTYRFDEKTGYHSQSLLAVPLKNHENEIVGVLQVINAQTSSGEVVPFSEDDMQLVLSLASQAAVSITNKQLIDGMRELFNSLVRLIATAIDEKSPYTSGHCKRLPDLTMLLAEAAHLTEHGELSDFNMTDEDRYELEVAAWLHDCGKITTPEYVMDKATKLQKIFDRVELVESRMEILRRDLEISMLREKLSAEMLADVDQSMLEVKQRFVSDIELLQQANKGGEAMPREQQDHVKQLAKVRWQDIHGLEQPLLTDDEVYNLCIVKGTLTAEEREVINNHIVATIKMLNTLPFPKHLQNVPEYAGGHHERVDGKGYPYGLKKEQMSVPARIMAIADVFEALTAQDRPYKDPMPLSDALAILENMSKSGHIDPALFDVFLQHKVYHVYAEKYLSAEQRDVK